ncbi:MAG: FadR family transcriptional regulator, partial [Methylobacteriaceae bacterium]|nr:FadR family transcriptional regulator [Methylobacteriaceae bacterium]
RCAAEHGAARVKRDGPEFIERGRAAVESGSLSEQIAADMDFHAFVTELSGNPLIGETTTPHWPYLRRVMAEVLRDDEEMPKNIWDEHDEILETVIAGDRNSAEKLSRQHILRAADIFVARLQAQQAAANEDVRARRSRLISR